MVIFAGDLTEKDFEDETLELRKLLKDNTNGITYEDSWGKRELVTRIKKHKHGYYVFFNFEANPESIKELSDPLKLNQKALRTLLIVLPDNYEPGKYKEIVLMEEEPKESKSGRPTIPSKPALAVTRAPRTKAAVSETTEKEEVKPAGEEGLAKVAGRKEEEELENVEKKLEDILDNPDIDIDAK